jgi:TPR repeat protein
MLLNSRGIEMSQQEDPHDLPLSTDQGLIMEQVEYSGYLLRMDAQSHEFEECEKYLQLAVCQGNPMARMRLGFCLFSGAFGRFDFSEAYRLFDSVSDSYRFAKVLRDSLSSSNCQLVRSSNFCQSGNLFSILRSSFDGRIGLIRVLNADLCAFPIDEDCRFPAWLETAHDSILYLIDVSQAQSHALRSLPSDLLLYRCIRT